jgi:hypothetical protein
MSTVNPKNLGHRVSSRDLNWADLCHKAWGSDFYAPDPGIYEFTGRKYDSTDKGLTGLYGVDNTATIEIDDPHGIDRYSDMDQSIEISNSLSPIHADGVAPDDDYNDNTSVAGYAIAGFMTAGVETFA